MLIDLFTRIWEDTGILAIQADQEGAKVPPLPYAVYKVTSPYIKGRGRGNTAYLAGPDSLTEEYTEQPLMTVSLSVFAKSGHETIALAEKLHGWFLFGGIEYLQERGIVVARLENIENRTTHLVDHYEYKYGFDVQLRTERTLTKEVNWIETVQITGGE